MLSVDHVRARRDKDRLVLARLGDKQRQRAVEIAEQWIALARASVGSSRDTLDAAFAAFELAPAERRLADGLKKLVEDGCEFEQGGEVDPVALRREVFVRSALERRSATLEAPFDRERVLGQSAAALGLDRNLVEEALYADLRGAQRLVRAPSFGAAELVASYERAQIQALFLRAVRVVAAVRCKSPDSYRVLFQKLKFRQLLYQLEPLPDGGYRVTIDGPFSLFEASTKYGLELALTLPALEACDSLELVADVVWGKTRTPLRFEHRTTSSNADRAAPSLRDEVKTLLEEFSALDTLWRARVPGEILDLPGICVCVPDLVFERGPRDAPVYVELLGYWSRDAVFRRVELVERGLPQRIVFALSSRLRVSEAVLPDTEHAALYVFRGKPSARALERKLEAVSARR